MSLDLIESELAQLGETLVAPASPKPKGDSIVKRLSERHRRLAQCLAEGMAPGEAGIVCGYVGSRVSVLQTDPSFKALIEFYRAQREEQFIGAARKLAMVAETGLDILQDRMEDNPDQIGTTTLVDIIKTATDRIGLGPTQKHEHLHAVLTAEDLHSLKQSVLGSSAKLVELLPSQQGGKVVSAADQLQIVSAEVQEAESKEGSGI